jgi:hypothetical protein
VEDEQAALLGEIRRIALGAEAARIRGQARAGAGTTGSQAGAGPHRAGAGGVPGTGQTGDAAPRGQRLAEEYVLWAALSEPRWATMAAQRLRPEQFSDPRCARVAGALLGHNNDRVPVPAEELARDPLMAEALSGLLVVEDGEIEEREFLLCVDRIERQAVKNRVKQLEEEITRGTLKKGDQRYEEYLLLVRALHGQRGKGES